MRRAASTVLLVACVVLDLAMVVLGALVLFVIVTGGGVFAVQGTTISLRSVGNPLSILAVLFLLRLPALRRVPFLVAASPPDFFARPLRGASQVADALTALDERRAIRWTIVALLIATVLKLANAWGYPGFFSGDDVEIHEMTFRQLFHLDVDVWNLRSPFYPMTFIYPVQALMVSAGFTDSGALVVAGRCVVAVASSLAIWLTFRAGVLIEGAAAGLVAACLTAISRLHVTFGGSELPRPVATVFVLLAFVCLASTRRSWTRSALAGCALGVAASCRFSEVVFLVPAIAGLCIERRIRAALVVVTGAIGTAVLILALGDWLYWGTPFHSLINIVQFTLVDRASSRGFEPFLFYVLSLNSWTSLPVAVLAIAGLRFGSTRTGLWWVLPLVLLSLLPHKEPRYLIPVAPFVALSAAQGVLHVLARLKSRAPVLGLTPEAGAWIVIGACVYGVLFEMGGWRFRKSSEGIVVAKSIAREGCDVVAVQQRWRLGGRLYLRTCRAVRDLDAPLDSGPDRLRSSIGDDVEWLVLDSRAATASLEAVESLGFSRVPGSAGTSFAVFRRTKSSP